MTDERAIAGEVREYTATDGCVLKYRQYRPVGPPRACVIGLHGIQSHSGWYQWSSSRLAEAGFDVRFLDRRGSGLNASEKPPHETASQYCLDIVRLLADLKAREGGTNAPVFLLSVSWGGKLAAGLQTYWRTRLKRMKLRRRWLGRHIQVNTPVIFDEDLLNEDLPMVAGMAFLYPAIFTQFDPTLMQRIGIWTANDLGLGRKKVSIPLDNPRLFTSEPHWQAFIRDDPLALRRVSLAFLRATLDLTRMAVSFPAQNSPPVFVALAGQDEIVDLPRTREWVGRLPTETTRLIEYPQARHTLEFDPCREQFVADLIAWIESLL